MLIIWIIGVFVVGEVNVILIGLVVVVVDKRWIKNWCCSFVVFFLVFFENVKVMGI